MARRRLTPAQPGNLSGNLSGAATGAPVPRMAPIAQITGQSAEAAALRDLARGLEAARSEGRMIEEIPLAEIGTGELVRDRIMLDREELEALKASIRAHGQRTPAEVMPLAPEAGPRFALISGWRRLSALSELHAETGEARFARIRALIRPAGEAAQAYVAMIEENEIRVGLSYYERARIVAELAARGVFADEAAALRTLFAGASRARRSKIGSFVELHHALGPALRFPAAIPERLGLALVAQLRAEAGAGQGGELARRLLARPAASAEAELAELARLAQPARPQPPAPVRERIAPGVEMTARRKGDRLSVTLSGAGLDEALLERLRRALQGQEG